MHMAAIVVAATSCRRGAAECPRSPLTASSQRTHARTLAHRPHYLPNDPEPTRNSRSDLFAPAMKSIVVVGESAHPAEHGWGACRDGSG